MTNQAKFRRGRSAAPMNADTAQHRWWGYEDARAGLGFRREYETFEPHNQRNYEAGRQYVAMIRGTGAEPPYWARNVRMDKPLAAAVGQQARSVIVHEMNQLFSFSRGA